MFNCQKNTFNTRRKAYNPFYGFACFFPFYGFACFFGLLIFGLLLYNNLTEISRGRKCFWPKIKRPSVILDQKKRPNDSKGLFFYTNFIFLTF